MWIVVCFWILDKYNYKQHLSTLKFSQFAWKEPHLMEYTTHPIPLLKKHPPELFHYTATLIPLQKCPPEH